MDVLYIGLSTNGVMRDNFILVGKYLAKSVNLHVITNSNISKDDIGVTNMLNVEYDRKNIKTFLSLTSIHKIISFIKKHHFDVAFIESPHPINLIIYRLLKKKPTVVYLHDPFPHSGMALFDKFIYQLQLNYIYRKVDNIIVSSDKLKQEILQSGLAQQDRIKVIYLGLLENHLYDIPEQSETIDVLFYGRLEYYKGLDVLIDSIKEINKTKKLNVVIISKGNIKDVYPTVADIPDNIVQINDYVSDFDLAKYICGSKMIVLPYRDATGTQTVQTIFYYQKPIIATKVGGFCEYIEDGIEGIIVPPNNSKDLADAILKLEADIELRKKLGEAGKKKLDKAFNNQLINQQYVNLFENMIGGSRSYETEGKK